VNPANRVRISNVTPYGSEAKGYRYLLVTQKSASSNLVRPAIGTYINRLDDASDKRVVLGSSPSVPTMLQ
jgi:hypothetical protein